MMTTMDGQPAGVDREVLLPLARAATACPMLQIEKWQTTRLSVQGRRTIYRFAGTGTDESLPKPWSLILKEISAPTSASAPDAHIGHGAYWPREPLLYAAGIPQGLSGDLRSPHCYGVVQPEEDVYWIWLEDLHDRYDGVWPLERFVLAGYHLDPLARNLT